MPMTFRLTSPFGALEEIRNGTPHNGIDIAMPTGTELHSFAQGVVEHIVDYGSQNIGKGVIVRLDDGTRAIYGHMDKVTVQPGEHIEPGELLGLSGNTGHSLGPHLHFGLWRDGHYIDPTPLADTVSSFAGHHDTLWGPLSLLAQRALDSTIGDAKAAVKEQVQQHIIDFLNVASVVAGDLIHAIALVGGGILIILGTVGLKQGYRWAGVLFVANVLIRYLLSGGAAR